MQDVVAAIREWNRGRELDRVRLKYAKMAASAFAFFRGTCHLFYRDWPVDIAIDDAPVLWIAGDLHLENFGSFMGEDGRAYFDVNDFDEAALAPASWDLTRLLCSIALAKLDEPEKLAGAFLGAYRETAAGGVPVSLTRREAAPPVASLLDKIERRTRKEFLDKRAPLAKKRRALLSSPFKTAAEKAKARYLPLLPLDREAIEGFLAGFARAQANPASFAMIDAARRIAGTGSLGLGRFAVLVEGEGSPDGNYVLDLKQAAPSAAATYRRLQPAWPDEASRVAGVRGWVQPHPPAMFAPVRFRGKSWLIRELQPSEDTLDLDRHATKPRERRAVLAEMGRATASMHLRGCGRQGAAAVGELRRWAGGDWRAPMTGYALAYADKVREDHKAWKARDEKRDPDRPVTPAL
jgi:uncharacterized protein (DUF2252 family)